MKVEKFKIWHKTEIATEEQNVSVYPNESWDGIIVEVTEVDGSHPSRLYLSKYEMDLLMKKMKDMMDYVIAGKE